MPPSLFSYRHVSFILILGALACGGSQTAPEPGGTASEDDRRCVALARPAVDQVLAAVEQHAKCSADTDCVSIEVGAACFDICTRAVNRTEVNAVNDAMGRADCTEFLAASCSVFPPTCAPPGPPMCNQGRCEE